MNYYPFHIGDYVSATRHLSWEEDAAFRRLLDTYYTTEKPLPADLRATCRLVMAQTQGQRDAVSLVLQEFFTLTESGWVNKRADEEIIIMRDKQQKQRDRANKRWHKPEHEHGIAAASENHAVASKNDANAMPPTPTPTPTPKKIPSVSGRGSRLQPDWTPMDAGFAFAAQQGLTNGKAALELEKFRDYWTAATGQHASKADWQAAWRTWVRKSVEIAGNSRAPVQGEPAWRTEQRDRAAAFAGPAAAKRPTNQPETFDVVAKRLD